MAAARQVFVAVIGLGGVSNAFLGQLQGLSRKFASQAVSRPQLSLILVSRSSKQLVSQDYKPLSFDTLADEVEKSSTVPFSPSQLVDYLSKAPGKVIVVDNTASSTVPESYPLLLSKGISVVTPNKKGFSSELNLWNSIFAAAANGTGPAGSGLVYHESTVGAGLPVISTLKDLVETGDTVEKIEGVFSGTMSFLFNSFMPVGGGGGSMSAEVRKAKELGYTEPDPRDDLNGLDVARKLTILGRLIGLQVESPTSFPVQSLIPKELESVSSGDEFLARLPEFDNQMAEIKAEAEREGKVLRYVGTIDVPAKALSVGLQKFDPSHPIAALKGSDNIISFRTARYPSPLVIQGAGAGGEVTAMGVTGDLIKVLSQLS